MLCSGIERITNHKSSPSTAVAAVGVVNPLPLSNAHKHCVHRRKWLVCYIWYSKDGSGRIVQHVMLDANVRSSLTVRQYLPRTS